MCDESKSGLAEAKDLFMRYGGSAFLMEREGVYDRYLAFRVPEDLEARWIEERCDLLLRQVDEERVAGRAFEELVVLFQHRAARRFQGKLLANVSVWASSLDTFTRLRFAEELVEMGERLRGPEQLDAGIPEICGTAIDLIERALEGKVLVADCYQSLPYLSDVLSKDQIMSRLESLRKRCRDLENSFAQ